MQGQYRRLLTTPLSTVKSVARRSSVFSLESSFANQTAYEHLAADGNLPLRAELDPTDSLRCRSLHGRQITVNVAARNKRGRVRAGSGCDRAASMAMFAALLMIRQEGSRIC